MSPTDPNEKLVFLDGELVSEAGAGAAAVSGSVLYGKGVFTTIAICAGEPFEWPRHAKRLANNSLALGLEVRSDTLERLRDGLIDLAARNGDGDGKARITVFDPSTPELWGGGPAGPSSVMIQTSERRPSRGPVSVAVSPFRVNSASPLAGLKTCNYLEPLLAKEEASRRGFDEAIRMNEKGIVTGCCLANLFWISRAAGALRTSALSTGCLPGTTRDYVLERMDVEEVETGLEELRADAEAMFLTSAVLGISPVLAVEGFERFSPAPENAISILPY